MPLPLIPIAIGTAGVAAGSALHAWLSQSPDAWHDKSVFNARMREMHGLALALNSGFSTMPAFINDKPALTAWRTTRDGFGKFYSDVGTLNYMGPSDAEVSQAKDYASKFYFWESEYSRLHGSGLAPAQNQGDLYNKAPDSYTPNSGSQTDWAEFAKWAAIGIGGAFLLKTVKDLFSSRRA